MKSLKFLNFNKSCNLKSRISIFSQIKFKNMTTVSSNCSNVEKNIPRRSMAFVFQVESVKSTTNFAFEANFDEEKRKFLILCWWSPSLYIIEWWLYLPNGSFTLTYVNHSVRLTSVNSKTPKSHQTIRFCEHFDDYCQTLSITWNISVVCNCWYKWSLAVKSMFTQVS